MKIRKPPLFHFLTFSLSLLLLSAIAALAAQLHLNYGQAPNDHTGDGLRTSFAKIDANFNSLWFGSETLSNKTLAGASGEIYRDNLFWYNYSITDPAQGLYFRDQSSNYLGRIVANSNGLPAMIGASSATALDITATETRGNEEVMLNCLSARQLFPVSNPYLGDAFGNFAISANTISTPTMFTTALTAAGLTVNVGTNQVTFGATNSAPVNTSTPVRWISVQVSGSTNAYRLPLYQ